MTLDRKQIESIKGFLDAEEGDRLFSIALDASRWGPCLEIGGYCGRSTLFLGTACKQNHQILFSIDHHRGSEEQQPGEQYFDPDLYDPQNCLVDTFKEFRKTLEMARLEDTVVPMVCRSDIAGRCWTTPLSLVFIDGGHSYTAVYTDYSTWAGHIMPDGYLLIHDIFKDPGKGGQSPYYIYKLAINSGLFRQHPMTKTLGILQRYPMGQLPENLPEP